MKAIKEFINFEKALKNFSVITNISKPIIRSVERYQEGLSYLSYCGFTVNDELIDKIKKLSIETPMDFNKSCYYYVNNYMDDKNPSA